MTSVFMLLVGVALAFIALFMPPPGEIHDSVFNIDNFHANDKNGRNFNSREQPKVKE